MDLGLNNLATCFDSTSGASFILDGRYLKAVNQWYNKQKAKLQSILDHQTQYPGQQSHRLMRLSRRREWRINDSFNRVAKYITDYCVSQGIGTLVVGNFLDSKQEINLGKKTNQNFVSIPYGKLLRKLKSKCGQLGIAFDETEESYTSKCSFLDGEAVQKQDQYAGKRIRRGLFRTAQGWLVNADVNGAANILAKFLASTDRLAELIRERVVQGFVTNPARVKVSGLLLSSSKSSGL